MQFQQDWPKDKKLQLFKFLPENMEKFHSTELYYYYYFTKKDSMRYTNYKKMFATTCDVHKPP